MAGELGFTIPPDSYPLLQDMAAAFRREPRNQIRHPHRNIHVPQTTSQLFLYQALYPIRLRAGTVTFPEDTSKSEPVIVCIRLGLISDESPKLLYGEDILRAYNALEGAGIVSNSDNRIEQQTFDNIVTNKTVDQIIEDRLDGFDGLYLLRARFIQSYVYSGCIIVGNEDEALWSLGRRRFTTDMSESMDQDDDVGLAELINTDNTAAGNATINEDILVRDPLQWDAFYLSDDVTFQIGLEWRNQTWFGDETVESPESWYNHTTEGWLPVLECDSGLGRDIEGKTDAAHAKSASGTISVWTGATAAGLTDSTDNITAYNRYADVAITKFVKCVAMPYGWILVSGEC